MASEDDATLITDDAAKAAAEKVEADKGTADKVEAEKVEADKADADAGDKDTDNADKGKDGAPEAYADFTLPEGMETDKEALEAFLPVAKELELTQDQAQKLVDLQTAAVAKGATAQADAWKSVTDGWRKETEADKGVGGDALTENLSLAKKGLEAFDDSEKVQYTDEDGVVQNTTKLRQLIDLTGIGNNVDFVRVFINAGKAIGEDKLHFGNVSGEATKEPENVLYPGMK